MKEKIDRRDVLTGIAGGLGTAVLAAVFANNHLPDRDTARSILPKRRKENEPQTKLKNIYRGRITIEKEVFDKRTGEPVPLYVRHNPHTDSKDLKLHDVIAMGENRQPVLYSSTIYIYNPEIVIGDDVIGLGNEDDMKWVKAKMVFLNDKGEEVEQEMHFSISKHPDATGMHITREPAGITERIEIVSVENGIGYLQNGETTEQISVGFVTTAQTDSDK